MPARHKINRLDIRPQLLRRNRADPAFFLSAAVPTSRVSLALSVNLKLQLDDIPEPLYPTSQDLLAVCLGADPVDFFAREQKLEDRIFVEEVARAVGDYRSEQWSV